MPDVDHRQISRAKCSEDGGRIGLGFGIVAWSPQIAVVEGFLIVDKDKHRPLHCGSSLAIHTQTPLPAPFAAAKKPAEISADLAETSHDGLPLALDRLHGARGRRTDRAQRDAARTDRDAR